MYYHVCGLIRHTSPSTNMSTIMTLSIHLIFQCPAQIFSLGGEKKERLRDNKLIHIAIKGTSADHNRARHKRISIWEMLIFLKKHQFARAAEPQEIKSLISLRMARNNGAMFGPPWNYIPCFSTVFLSLSICVIGAAVEPPRQFRWEQFEKIGLERAQNNLYKCAKVRRAVDDCLHVHLIAGSVSPAQTRAGGLLEAFRFTAQVRF